MKRIVGGSEMKALDGCTITGMGVPSCVLMERAALAVVDAMEGQFCGNVTETADLVRLRRREQRRRRSRNRQDPASAWI